MSFRTLIILLTILSTLGRIVAEFIVIGSGSQANLPITIHVFSIALIVYAITILIYDEFKRLSPLPFVILFLTESIVFIINLFLLYDQDGKWYGMYHMPVFDQVITGSYLSVLVNVIVVIYYFTVVRKRYL